MSGFDSNNTSDNCSNTLDDSNNSVNDVTQDSQLESSDTQENSLDNQTDSNQKGEVDAANNLEEQTLESTEQTETVSQLADNPQHTNETTQQEISNPQEFSDIHLEDIPELSIDESLNPNNIDGFEQSSLQTDLTDQYHQELDYFHEPPEVPSFGEQAQDKLNDIADKVFGNTPDWAKESITATGLQNIEAGYERAADQIFGKERDLDDLPKPIGVNIKGKF